MESGDWINLGALLLAVGTTANNLYGEYLRNKADKERESRFEAKSRDMEMRGNRVECAAEFAALIDKKTELVLAINEIEGLDKIEPRDLKDPDNSYAH